MKRYWNSLQKVLEEPQMRLLLKRRGILSGDTVSRIDKTSGRRRNKNES